MSLEDLFTVPEDEKAVLILTENHETDCIEPTLELIEAFKPDAVAVESRPDILGSRVLRLFRELRGNDPGGAVLTLEDREHLGKFYDHISCMVTSRVYAAKRDLPLYYLDWEPFCPLHQQDVLSEIPLPLPYRELKRCFAQTVDDLFWKGAAAEARRQVPEMEVSSGVRRLRGWLGKDIMKAVPLSREEEQASVDWYIMLGSHSGMTLRNEYSAMGLNALDKKRILYVCGKEHTYPKRELRKFKGFTPLQYLVDAPHTFVADMEYAVDSDDKLSKLDSFAKSLGYNVWLPKGIKKKEPLKLPWDNVSFYCPVCHGE